MGADRAIILVGAAVAYVLISTSRRDGTADRG